MKSNGKRVNKNHIQQIKVIDTTSECPLCPAIDCLFQVAQSIDNTIKWYENILKKDKIINEKLNNQKKSLKNISEGEQLK